jgi:hypothetical protein
VTDFFSTEDGQYASLAKQYLEGALVLDGAQRDRGKVLFLQTLALAGQGFELMLKGCTLWNGGTVNTSGRGGHALINMWESDVCEPVRGNVFANASLINAEDRVSGKYPDASAVGEVLREIDQLVRALADLHGMPKVYPLRYPADPNILAPRTPFLVKTLWATADDFVKRPNDFKLDSFHGRFPNAQL